MSAVEKSKWIALVQEVRNRPKPQPVDWKSISEMTKIGAMATVALVAGLVISGAVKKEAS